MFVEILEETLRIKSVLSDKLSEVGDNCLYVCSLSWRGLSTVVLDIGASSSDLGVNTLFETLLGEDFVNVVAELPPLDMLACLGSLVDSTKLLELLVGDRDLGHAHSHSELVGSDEPRSQLVEISEEFVNSDSLLEASLADSCKNVVHVDWGVTDDFSLADSSLSLWEVIEAVVVFLSNLKELL